MADVGRSFDAIRADRLAVSVAPKSATRACVGSWTARFEKFCAWRAVNSLVIKSSRKIVRRDKVGYGAKFVCNSTMPVEHRQSGMTSPHPAPDGILPRWLHVQQPLHEIVPATAHHIVGRAAVCMVRVRNQQQIEVLVRLDQRIHHEPRVLGRNIVVHRPGREQQVPLQVPRLRLVRLGIIVVRAVRAANEQPLVPFAEVVLVEALVVISRLGDAHLPPSTAPPGPGGLQAAGRALLPRRGR